MRLITWVSLDESHWEVSFAPCWKIELCLEGRQFSVPFKLLVRVGGIRVRGELRLSCDSDLSDTLLSFTTMPKFDMSIDSEVSLGSVPMPLQRGASALIRHELRKWIANKAVAPHAMRLKRSAPDEDRSTALSPSRSCGTGVCAAPDAVGEVVATPVASLPPPPYNTPQASSDALLGGASAATVEPTLPTGTGAGDDERGATADAPAADHSGARASTAGDSSGVSDEELRRAILAAVMKHDNPRVGVGRKKGFLPRSSKR